MDIEKLFNEKIQQFEDFKKRIIEINQKIGALQEEGRALHMAAMEVKGALDALSTLKAEEETKKAEAAKLILPDKALVAADGKTVISDAANNPTEPSADAPAQSVALEVK